MNLNDRLTAAGKPILIYTLQSISLFMPSWKRIADTDDLITSEIPFEDLIVRIEARKNEVGQWDIFKTYLNQAGLSFTEEYSAKTREEVQYLMAALQREKLLRRKEIALRRLQRAKRLQIRVKRHFKDYNVEKWNFAVDDNEYENVLYLREAESVEVSVIMPEKHRALEKPILSELHAILGLDSTDLDLKEEIYYYTTRSEDTIQSKRCSGVFLGKVEMGFDMSDNES